MSYINNVSKTRKTLQRFDFRKAGEGSARRGMRALDLVEQSESRAERNSQWGRFPVRMAELALSTKSDLFLFPDHAVV